MLKIVKWRDRPKQNKKFIFQNKKGNKLVVLGLTLKEALKWAEEKLGGKNERVEVIG